MITERINSHNLFLQGFRNTKMADPEKTLQELREAFPEMELQLLRADRVAGREHLSFAAKNAIDSFAGKGRRAKHLSMEFLLFASGQHQIIEAIKLLGVTYSTTDIVLVGVSRIKHDMAPVIGNLEQQVKGVRDDAVIAIQKAEKAAAIKKAYNINDRELESSRVPGETKEMLLERLVIERSALLVLES